MINICDINIQNWHTLLQDVNPQKDVPSDKVICMVKKDGERFYEVLDKDDWESISQDPLQKTSYARLRLHDIISVSNRLMAEKSRAPVSLNPLLPIFMPINGWKKNYQIGLLVRTMEILNSKDLYSAKDLFSDKDGQKVSQLILDELLEIEEENQQLREIFTCLEIMSEKADQHRLQRVQTIWERCIHWLCTFLFGDESAKIKDKLEVELGKRDQTLDIGGKMIQAMIFKAANEFLKYDGQPTLSDDQMETLFPNGFTTRVWTLGKGPQYQLIIRLACIWEHLEKAKQSIVDDEKVE
jgi:hypothetical protein